MKNQVDMNNCLAIELLEILGISEPSQEQIDLVESVVGSIVIDRRLIFDKRLTRREGQCLFWSAKGKTSQEIADIYNLKKSTIDSYKKGLIRKLGCSNMTQAVFEGVLYNLVVNRLPRMSKNITKVAEPQNYLALEYLAKLGNENPTQKQIDVVEFLLSSASEKLNIDLTFDLNSKELICLFWAAYGKSVKETACIINADVQMVDRYQKAIQRKLNCNTMAHAVFKGVRYGYILPIERAVG